MDEHHLAFASTMTPSITHYDDGWMLILADSQNTLAISLTEEQAAELAAVINSRMN